MPSRKISKQHTPGEPPLAQQKDERGPEVIPEEQQLGNTRQDGRRDPKLPHERDETAPDAASANAAAAPGNEMMKRAHEGAESGRQDSSKSDAMDQTYHELRKGS